MIVAMADTRTIFWYLFADSRMGKAASDFIDSTTANCDSTGASAHTLLRISMSP